MADNINQLGVLPTRRIGTLIAPREHGAWGLLLVPLATGAVLGLLRGGGGLPVATFTIAALALFWLRTPVESLLGTSVIRAQTPHERRVVGATLLALASIAGLALLSLFWAGRNHELFILGSIAISAFVAQALLRKLGRQTRMLAQVVGTLGLTVTAPAAYYLATGHLDREVWSLWTANFLFAGNQIHFVQLRIHSARISDRTEKLARGRNFLLGQVLLAAALVFAWRVHFLPGLAALAFLPLLVRGTSWFFERQTSLAVRRLGWTELAHAVVFGTLLIAAFLLG